MDILRLLRTRWIDSLIVTVLILIAGFFILHNLGFQSLHPWDEAWYAAISRNILITNNPLDLQFNQWHYWDHPPLGFYLESLSFMLFGVNEFAARLPQALLGIATVVSIYFVGKQMGNRWMGVAAALIVLSSRWFLFRSRTGNLDILLTFSQLAFFWSAYTTVVHKKIWLPALALSISLLSKTTISITLAPLLLLAWYERHQIKRIQRKEIYSAIAAGLAPLVPWYTYNTLKYGAEFLMQTIFVIGLRKGSVAGVSLGSFKQTLMYFHSAVHRWYSPFLLSVAIAVGLWIKGALQKKWNSIRPLTWTLLYFGLAAFPFLLSVKTEIWHLIPLVVPMALLIGLAGILIIQETVAVLKQIPFVYLFRGAGFALFLVAITFLSQDSLRSYWSEFVDISTGVSEAAQLSGSITTKQLPLYVTNDAFYPTIVYYANLDAPTKIIKEYEFSEICVNRLDPFLFITNQSFLNKTQGWKKLNQQGEMILVEFSNHTCGPKDWPKPV